MTTNPLFPSSSPSSDGSFQMPEQQPVNRVEQGANHAAQLIRDKLSRLYSDAPDTFAELRESESTKVRSRHQQFMYDLSTSGRSLAEIQTAWHNYYLGLPDAEKHEVWHEFYAASGVLQRQPAQPKQPIASISSISPSWRLPDISSRLQPLWPRLAAYRSRLATLPWYRLNSIRSLPNRLATMRPSSATPAFSVPTVDPRNIRQISGTIRDKVTAGGRMHAKHFLHSLLFGLVTGAVVIVILLFGFFNEVFIAPFIQPARRATATPIIVDPNSITPSSTPEVIIPKINLEIPADFSQTSTDETVIENALQNGIVHYPSTVLPGQNGNAAFFGHSSNNILNPGHYKFAFVLLHELVPGDTFYITYGGKVYIYKVRSKQVVDPSEVGVLNNIPGTVATATLITCDPPGTSLHRLVVAGDQISPDPSINTAGNNTSAIAAKSTQLPGNGPSLPSRLWHWLF